MRQLALLALIAALAACDDQEGGRAEAPGPVRMTEDAVSHFCRMGVLEHPGPKAQIHVAGMAQPLFFSQVRDAVAFLKGPERMGEVRAVYVSDMGRAPAWESPGPDNWVAGEAAHFVVGSDRRGGMGAPEIVPFGEAVAAEAFAAQHGGRVMTLEAIPVEAALGAVDLAMEEVPQ